LVILPVAAAGLAGLALAAEEPPPSAPGAEASAVAAEAVAPKPERVEVAPVAVPSIPGLEGEPVALTLRDVLLATLAENLDVKIVEKDRDVAGEQVWAEYGIYDPVLESGLVRSRTDRQGRSFAGDEETGRSKSYETDTTATGALTQRTPIGTIVQLFANDSLTDDHTTPGGNTIDPSNTAQAGFSVTQPLLKNAGTLVNNSQIRIARKRLEQANDGFEFELINQLDAVIAAYWEVDFANRNLEAQREALASANELERVNRARVEVGTLPRLALLQAQAQVAERESIVAASEAVVLAAQDNLLTLMNWGNADRVKTWNRPVQPLDPPSYLAEVKLDDSKLMAMALENRPDYRSAKLGVDIADIDRRVAKWQRLPELNLVGGYSRNGLEDDRNDAWETARGGDYSEWSVGGQFRYPIFNRSARALARQTTDLHEQSQLVVENTELLVTREVRDASRSVRTALAQIKATSRQVVADVEKLQSERKRMDVGERTTFDVLDFQDDLAESRARHARALADYQIALAELGRSMGILLQVHGIAVEDLEGPGGWDVLDGETTGGKTTVGDPVDWKGRLGEVAPTP